MNHDIKKKGSYGVFAFINIIQDKDELLCLRHLVQDTQEQTNRASKTVKDISENIIELTQSIKSLKSDVEGLKDGLKDEIQLRKDMRSDLDKQVEIVSKKVDKKLIFLQGAMWTLSAAGMILITLLTCWANGWLNFGGGIG